MGSCRVQRSFELRVAHDDRDAKAAAEIDERIRRIQLDDDRARPGLPQLA